MTESMGLKASKTIIETIPLLSSDKRTQVGKITLTHWEENRVHHILVSEAPYFVGQTFSGWSAKVALDKLRENLELEGALITLEGALIYAVYSDMCHDMGGGYSGYNYKNRMPSDKTIPERIVTFDITDSNEYTFISTITEQKGFWENRLKSISKSKIQ